MKIIECFTVSDFRRVAECRVPRFVFDFIDGGAGAEECLRANIDSFRNVNLIPRIKETSNTLSLKSEAVGIGYSAPFGVAPLGLCGIIDRSAEIILAKAAAKYNVPFISSAASNRSTEDIAKACGVAPWFQLYMPRDNSYVDYLIDRSADSGCPVLVVTIDAPVSGRRIRDLRNGLSLPYKASASNIWQAIKHPRWLANQVRGGKLSFPNFEGIMKRDSQLNFSEIMALQTGGALDWHVIQKIREKWKNKLVLKGVLSVDDAIRSKQLGVDAIIISNHGGRQLDKAPAPLSVISEFTKAGLEKEFLMIDSGIHSGEDMLVGLSKGAGFSFLGRGFLYSLMAGSEEGVDRYFSLLFDELTVGMKLLGCHSPADLNCKYGMSIR